MKKLLFLTLILSSCFTLYSQDKIVLKDKPDTIFCKIKSVTTSNIFYIEKGEHKSEYMRNVVYHTGTQKTTAATPNKKVEVQKEKNVQGGSLITKRQNTIQILGLIKIRDKYPIASEGYELSFVYTLPQTGFIWLIAIEPTFYIYKKIE